VERSNPEPTTAVSDTSLAFARSVALLSIDANRQLLERN
jgi:hypothetical protein